MSNNAKPASGCTGPSDCYAGIDELRRKMVDAGIPSEYAAIATGLVAEYAQAAYQRGYNRGYDHKSPFISKHNAGHDRTSEAQHNEKG
jgi:hypothetical protein